MMEWLTALFQLNVDLAWLHKRFQSQYRQGPSPQ